MPGVASPTRSATLTLAGVTEGAQAAIECNLAAARQLYHRRRIAWRMSDEGIDIHRGDVVRFTHDLVGGGDACRDNIDQIGGRLASFRVRSR